MSRFETVTVSDLEAAIEEYKSRGFRLDMIFPADDPREAVLSEPPAIAGGLSSASDGVESDESRSVVRLVRSNDRVQPPATAGGSDGSDWIRGRAGMEYRDLIPDRLGGKVIASHIRLNEGGEVPDYVHYHKIDFQVIYCKKGRIRVVYEDQGEPFWLETGDLVLQPPQIRHRVLECTAGAEVIEIGSPAEHETWVEHELDLPNSRLDPDREFSGRRFFRYERTGSKPPRDETEAALIDLAKSLGNAAPDEILVAINAFLGKAPAA
ncbi:MAG: hypothetical protein JO053_05080 [Acidobacteria bacterium]|nr:hypothetical protein [Acidobacteriota bacterium]